MNEKLNKQIQAKRNGRRIKIDLSYSFSFNDNIA